MTHLAFTHVNLFDGKLDSDLIKILSTGGVMDAKRLGEAGRPQITIEEISAACDEAH